MGEAAQRSRVLIVEDSAYMRKVLHRIISSDPQLEVVGEARDGREAVALAGSLCPDVITMDLNMPHVDGLQAIELIMSQNPRPVVIVSSESREGASSTLRGLELGAIDFVPKPSSGIDLDMHNVAEELNRKLKTAAKVRVVRTATRSKALLGTASAATAGTRILGADRSGSELKNQDGRKFPVVVIAASTGGPATLMRLLPSFPGDFPASLFIVQHMPATFTSQFAEQLGSLTALPVKVAEGGEPVRAGRAYVCPGSHHLRISAAGKILLDDGPRISGYRPCADETLASAAAFAGPMAIAIVLTGMGNDGTKGIHKIKAAGGLVIAQDEASAVIFGMPAEAIKTGKVDKVLALEQIYPAVERQVLKLCPVSLAGVM